MSNRILEINKQGLRKLDPTAIDPADFTPEALDHIFGLYYALWRHSGNPKDPHVEISPDICSNGFVNLRLLVCDPVACGIMAKLVVHNLRKRPEYATVNVDWVIGSDHTSATFSYEVAKLLGASHAFTERGPDKSQIWRRGVIGQNEIVLQAEALISTGKTAKAVRQALRAGNPHPINFFPAVLALASRSNNHLIDGIYPILGLRHYEMQTWERAQCPLHQQGSVSIHEPQHRWHMLTGKS
ncbi:MAG: hypothetical protein PHC53_04165 [Patescibacteria group bacterium]|nr:hypothetical protein [Patescibacteria group bacterium]